MEFSFEELPGEPIAIATFLTEGSREGGQLAIRQLAEFLERHGGPAFLIADLSNMIASFSGVVRGLAAATRKRGQETDNPMLDPRLQTVIVGSNALARLWAEAMGQMHYGGRKVPFFETLEEALTYAREQIAEQKGEGAALPGETR
ncbi:MAG TPA: hypothetical protein ENI95_04725 [Chloroflexi bacterium]|nr:hypothetical protein [Chloroflexota bacterium]